MLSGCFDLFVFLMSFVNVALKCALVSVGPFGISVMNMRLALAVTLEPQTSAFKPPAYEVSVVESGGFAEFVPGRSRSCRVEVVSVSLC